MVNTPTFNVRFLKTINHLPELTISPAENNKDIIYVQGQIYYHSELELKYHAAISMKNSINAVIEIVGILLSSFALKP